MVEVVTREPQGPSCFYGSSTRGTRSHQTWPFYVGTWDWTLVFVIAQHTFYWLSHLHSARSQHFDLDLSALLSWHFVCCSSVWSRFLSPCFFPIVWMKSRRRRWSKLSMSSSPIPDSTPFKASAQVPLVPSIFYLPFQVTCLLEQGVGGAWWPVLFNESPWSCSSPG